MELTTISEICLPNLIYDINSSIYLYPHHLFKTYGSLTLDITDCQTNLIL